MTIAVFQNDTDGITDLIEILTFNEKDILKHINFKSSTYIAKERAAEFITEIRVYGFTYNDSTYSGSEPSRYLTYIDMDRQSEIPSGKMGEPHYREEMLRQRAIKEYRDDIIDEILSL